jgi:hypothetical protein
MMRHVIKFFLCISISELEPGQEPRDIGAPAPKFRPAKLSSSQDCRAVLFLWNSIFKNNRKYAIFEILHQISLCSHFKKF